MRNSKFYARPPPPTVDKVYIVATFQEGGVGAIMFAIVLRQGTEGVGWGGFLSVPGGGRGVNLPLFPHGTAYLGQGTVHETEPPPISNNISLLFNRFALSNGLE